MTALGDGVATAQVKEAVKEVLASGDFLLPDGSNPREMIEDHTALLQGQGTLRRNMGVLLDKVVGPVKVDYLGDLHPDGERDEEAGLAAKTEVAYEVAQEMKHHLSNGGIPVHVPVGLKIAIWTGAFTFLAAAATAIGVVMSAPTP